LNAAQLSGCKRVCAVEAKLLDVAGTLDLPADLHGIDAIYAADHQVPLIDGPHTPSEVKAMISEVTLSADEVIEAIVTATANSLRADYPVVIAHLFSILPKLALAEEEVPLTLIEELAASTSQSGSQIEVSERWRCPSMRTLRPFLTRGVQLLLSTDSHRSDTIGRYDYCQRVVEAIESPVVVERSSVDGVMRWFGIAPGHLFVHVTILFVYCWLAASMLAAWAAKLLEQRGKLRILSPPLIYISGYGPLLCAITFAAYISEARGAEMKWDKTEKSGKVAVA
jgi:hypothetical protein